MRQKPLQQWLKTLSLASLAALMMPFAVAQAGDEQVIRCPVTEIMTATNT